ncbi:hypothetical protein MMC25_003356 [Agyrium rufum]|nr:hypothetical protein [Agyrium rufum]
MRLLILGGTDFVGLAVAVESINRGHDVTTFNRGTKPTPKEAKAIIGDRLSPNGYNGLEGMTFDAVVDTWFGEPSAVQSAVTALRGRISHYTYISTISVYDDKVAELPLTETSPVVIPAKTDSGYAENKRGGELAAEESGVPVLIARPGLILGPHENIGRLPWWLTRMHLGGRTLAPGPQDNGIQFIDARDIACFVLDAAEKCLGGVYNTLSRPAHIMMSDFLDTINAITGGNADLIWKDPETILKSNVAPWSDLPGWLPPGRDHDLLFGCSVEKAFAAGLRIRAASETIADTWAWLHSLKEPPKYGKVGLSPEKEAALLGEVEY